MAADPIPVLPEQAPRMGNRFTRWVGRSLLRILGWKVHGEFPNHAKLVVALGPHTSNWDFFVAFPALMATGLRVSYLMKKEAFIWPFRNFFIRWGGIPLNRQAAQDTVDQIHTWYREHERVWVAITPEGTRSKVTRWKTGFLRLAYTAEVPVLLVAWDYPSKTIVLDQCWPLSGDLETDVVEIQNYINSTYRGRHPQNQ